MKLPRRQFLHLAAGAAALPAVSRIARAQTYPARPITMVVAFGAGGPSDIIARIVAEGMRGSLGQPVIVENVPGASGTIGVGRVARAAPDGYTVVSRQLGYPRSQRSYVCLQYDLQRDFEPVSLVSSDPLMIVARKTSSARNLKEFIAWLKANPNNATQGTTGAGGISTVGGLFFQKETETRFRFVPYRAGLGAAMQELVAGQIDFMIDTAANSLPQVRAGTIKAFAVTSKQRLTLAPDIPTVAEEGLPGLFALNWQAAYLPKAASKEIVAKLNASIVVALADANVRRRLADIGQEIFSSDQQTPEALRTFQSVEIEKWWPIIKAANIKGE